MKKLLFIFLLAAISTLATSSFKPIQSANNDSKQTVHVAAAVSTDAPEDVKKDDKKKKQSTATSCCPAKTQKAECTEVQQKNCAASKTNCQEVKKCPKK